METKVVDLVILNTLILEHDLTQFMAKLRHHFFDHHGQLVEVCSQNPIICGNESCRARDSEHINF